MERSPFRDDIGAAHARAEKLEAENRELRAKLAAAKKGADGTGIASRRVKVAFGVATVVALAGILAAMRTAAPAAPATEEEARDLRGIAIAPSPAATPALAQSAHPKATPLASSRGACVCAAGDPLCSCL